MVDTVAFSQFRVAASPARGSVDVALQVFECWVLVQRRCSGAIALAELETAINILRERFAARPFGVYPPAEAPGSSGPTSRRYGIPVTNRYGI